MAEPYNPNDPDSLGCEWFPPGASSQAINSLTASAMQTLRALASDSIDTVYTRANASGSGTFMLEVYNSGDEIPDNVSGAGYWPNEDVSRTVMTTQAGGTTSLFASINQDPDLSVYIQGSTTLLAAYKMRFGTSGVLTGKRILRVYFAVSVGIDTESQPAMTLQFSVDGTNVSPLYNIPAQSAGIGTGQPRTLLSYTGNLLANTAELATDPVWTVAHIQAMDSTGWLEIKCPTPGGILPRIFSVQMYVVYADENRLAWGYETPSSSGEQTITFNPLVTPAGGTSFSRTNGNDYSYVLRRFESNGAGQYISVPLLLTTPPLVGAKAYSPTIWYINGYVAELNTELSGAFPFWLRNTGPTQTADGQPYHTESVAECHTGNDVEQEVNPSTNGTYALVRVLCAPKTTGAIDDMIVNVRDRSGNTLKGTGTITREDWVDETTYVTIGGVAYKVLNVPLSGVTALSSANTYYIEFQSTASGSAVPGGIDAWGIVYLEGEQSQSAYGRGSYGFTTEGVEVFTDSACALLVEQPSPPAAISAALGTQTINDVGGICANVSYPYVTVSWSATALGADFGYYEVQRSSDHGVTWYTIADNLDTEAGVTMRDYEGPRNIGSQYRVRVVRVDEAPSEWVISSEITPPDNGCTIAFVSNRDPSLNVAYMDTTPRDYKFLDADDIVEYKLYDRDMHVTFSPTEERGIEWMPTLTVYTMPQNGVAAPPNGPGLGVFQPLRDLMRADIPYVCVLDSDGNQLFAGLQVPNGRRAEPEAYYSAQIRIIQVATEPDTTPELP